MATTASELEVTQLDCCQSTATERPQNLRQAYCPPIDDAVFYAIASDYDLPSQQDELRQVLDGLKEAALQEENTTFHPIGTGG